MVHTLRGSFLGTLLLSALVGCARPAPEPFAPGASMAETAEWIRLWLPRVGSGRMPVAQRGVTLTHKIDDVGLRRCRLEYTLLRDNEFTGPGTGLPPSGSTEFVSIPLERVSSIRVQSNNPLTGVHTVLVRIEGEDDVVLLLFDAADDAVGAVRRAVTLCRTR